jgi:hypothetical protein
MPPEEGTPEHARPKHELEEMVRLVEAVQLVDTSIISKDKDPAVKDKGLMGIPDGRIWPEGVGMKLSINPRVIEFEDDAIESGRELLKHASWTRNGHYVVEAQRRKK